MNSTAFMLLLVLALYLLHGVPSLAMPLGSIEYALLSSAVCSFANLHSQTMVRQRIKRYYSHKGFGPLQAFECRLGAYQTGACESFRRLNQVSHNRRKERHVVGHFCVADANDELAQWLCDRLLQFPRRASRSDYG
jgi:hypothetical protein